MIKSSKKKSPSKRTKFIIPSILVIVSILVTEGFFIEYVSNDRSFQLETKGDIELHGTLKFNIGLGNIYNITGTGWVLSTDVLAIKMSSSYSYSDVEYRINNTPNGSRLTLMPLLSNGSSTLQIQMFNGALVQLDASNGKISNHQDFLRIEGLNFPGTKAMSGNTTHFYLCARNFKLVTDTGDERTYPGSHYYFLWLDANVKFKQMNYSLVQNPTDKVSITFQEGSHFELKGRAIFQSTTAHGFYGGNVLSSLTPSDITVSDPKVDIEAMPLPTETQSGTMFNVCHAGADLILTVSGGSIENGLGFIKIPYFCLGFITCLIPFSFYWAILKHRQLIIKHRKMQRHNTQRSQEDLPKIKTKGFVFISWIITYLIYWALVASQYGPCYSTDSDLLMLYLLMIEGAWLFPFFILGYIIGRSIEAQYYTFSFGLSVVVLLILIFSMQDKATIMTWLLYPFPIGFSLAIFSFLLMNRQKIETNE